MSTTTSTEPRQEPITAQDKRALRHADTIVFRLYRGQATIEANLDKSNSSTGFDEKHTIYVGGPFVADYTGGWSDDSRDTRDKLPQDEAHRAIAFHMEHSPKYGNDTRTLVDRLRIGGTVELHWVRSSNNGYLTKAGLYRDVLYLHVLPPEGKTSPRPDVYMVDSSVCENNSARMVKVDWSSKLDITIQFRSLADVDEQWWNFETQTWTTREDASRFTAKQYAETDLGTWPPEGCNRVINWDHSA